MFSWNYCKIFNFQQLWEWKKKYFSSLRFQLHLVWMLQQKSNRRYLPASVGFERETCLGECYFLRNFYLEFIFIPIHSRKPILSHLEAFSTNSNPSQCGFSAHPKWLLPITIISLFKLQPRFISFCNEFEIMTRDKKVWWLRHETTTDLSWNASATVFWL